MSLGQTDFISQGCAHSGGLTEPQGRSTSGFLKTSHPAGVQAHRRAGLRFLHLLGVPGDSQSNQGEVVTHCAWDVHFLLGVGEEVEQLSMNLVAFEKCLLNLSILKLDLCFWLLGSFCHLCVLVLDPL